MKGRILNAVENDRARLIQQGEQINGKDPRTAPVEHLILGLTNVYVQSVNLKLQLSVANGCMARLQGQKVPQQKIAQAQARVEKLTQQLDAANDTLESLGLTLSTLPEEVSEKLNEGLESTAYDLTNLVNVRDLELTEGQRCDHRNSAMSAVAGLMGMNKLIARSENMKFLDEDGNEVEGTFMEFADGLDLHGKDGLKEFNKVADDPFAPPCKALQGQPQVGP